MSFCIAIANAKGGCGKSTIAMLLAGSLSRHLDVVVADSDPQGTASLWGGLGSFPCPVSQVYGAGDIRSLSSKHSAVVVDCPPTVDSVVMSAALSVADLVLVPCAPEPADVWATTLLLEKCRREHPSVRLLVVLNKVPPGTALSRDSLLTIETAGWPLAKSRLGLRTAYKEAMAMGTTLEDVKGRGGAQARSEFQELSLEAMTVLSAV